MRSYTGILLTLFAMTACQAGVRVTCLGNSITAGRYPTFLQWDIGGAFEIQNAGVPATTLTYNGENPWIATGMIDTVAMFAPDIVYVMLGTNDSKAITWDTHSAEFPGDYCRLIDTLRALCPGVRVRACLPTPAWANNGGIRGDVIHNEVVPAVQQAAQMRSVPVIDLHTPFLDKSVLFPDGFHPSDNGAWEIARLVAAELRSEYGVAPDLTAGGTVSSSGYVSEDYAHGFAFDNNPFTAWLTPNTGEKWLQVTFSQPTTVDRWEVAHAWDQQASRITRDYKLQASDNGTSWSDVDAVSGNTDEWTSREIAPRTARHFRLSVTYGSVFGSARISGFVLRHVAGTVDVAQQPDSGARRQSPAQWSASTGLIVDVSGRRISPNANARAVVSGRGLQVLPQPGTRIRSGSDGGAGDTP
ncbi:MAG: hypothetical protein GF331_14115 [Chitinivibrionales bacterium]|nr:hypothetical protein [Chitinivibrionales bacterium]